MRILKEDANAGEITVRPDTVDDLWHLRHVVRVGDVAIALTWRTPEEAAKDKLRTGKVEKQMMTLAVRVETVELHADANRLRLLGVIVEGPQEHGAHHTLNIEPRTDLTIRKERWTREEQLRLQEAVAASARPVATFLALDDEEATVAVLRPMGLKKAAEVRGRTAGKRYETASKSSRDDFFEEILEALRQQRTDGPLLVIGPGFWKDQFLTWAKGKDAAVVRNAVVEPTAHAGMPGITEAIRRGVVDRVQADKRAATEIQAVEELLEAIARDAPATYGEGHVRRALEAGAAARVLVTDERVRHGGDAVLDLARQTGAETLVVSSESEAGRKLDSLGGFGALLRYRLSE